MVCSELLGQTRKLPQDCSFKAEYFRTKICFVMQVFGLVETLEIKFLPRRSFLKVDFEERVAFWRGVQVLTGSLSSNLGKMSTTGAN